MKKRYIGILFLAMALMAGGCWQQGQDVDGQTVRESSGTPSPTVEATPAEETAPTEEGDAAPIPAADPITAQDKDEIEELLDLNLYKQSPEFDFYDEPAVLRLYTYAELAEDGRADWDDGQRWAVTLETEGGTYLLLHQYIQSAVLEANAMYFDESGIWKVAVRKNGTISYDIYEYTFDKASQSFLAASPYTTGASFYNYGTETIY